MVTQFNPDSFPGTHFQCTEREHRGGNHDSVLQQGVICAGPESASDESCMSATGLLTALPQHAWMCKGDESWT